jgi:hypothetical protein
MKALFKHSNGRLKTSRIALLVFVLLLVCLSFAYKMGKTADKVFVKIEHVFEAEKQEKTPEETVAEINKTIEKTIPDKRPEIKQEKTSDAEPEQKPVPIKSEKLAETKVEKPVVKPMSEIKPKATKKNLPVKKAKPEVTSQTVANRMAGEIKVVEKARNKKTKPPEKDQVRFTLAQDLKLKADDKSLRAENANKENLKLSSKEYFEVYKQWQEQGEAIDKGKALVGLRIHNLEHVYDLFQMKAVVLKDGAPHTDLEDDSRVANAALSEFSSTCFIVSNPWKKWGSALKESGFSQKDDIEIRYYTYEFVRNSIYARALKAFEWSVAKQNLPEDTDPSTADVLGVVHAVNKTGGGSFGVFVPKRVDFKSGVFVDIDPLACFKGQKDIEALNRAGLL